MARTPSAKADAPAEIRQEQGRDPAVRGVSPSYMRTIACARGDAKSDVRKPAWPIDSTMPGAAKVVGSDASRPSGIFALGLISVRVSGGWLSLQGSLASNLSGAGREAFR